MKKHLLITLFIFFASCNLFGQNPGLLIHYDFIPSQTNNNLLLDLSGNNNHASLFTGVPATSTLNGLYFNGISLYRILNLSAPFPNNFTYYAEIIPESYCILPSVCDWNAVISRRISDNDPWNSASLDLNPTIGGFNGTTRNVSLNVSNGVSGSGVAATSLTPLFLGNSVKIIAIKNGCNLEIYVDCILVGTSNINWGGANKECALSSINYPLYFGGNNKPAQQFKGSMKEIKIFNYVLNQNEINDICLGVNTEKNSLNPSNLVRYVPFNNSITFLDKVSNVSIYDVTGKLLNTSINGESINTSNYAQGIYVVKGFFNNKPFSTKIAIN